MLLLQLSLSLSRFTSKFMYRRTENVSKLEIILINIGPIGVLQCSTDVRERKKRGI